MSAETAVECPDCGEVITVPIHVELRNGESGQEMFCTPDLADLWAHAWTHPKGESSTTANEVPRDC